MANKKKKIVKTYQFQTRKSFKAFVAIFRNDGNHIAICAPSMFVLRSAWKKITGFVLIESEVQKVRIIEE